MNVRKENMLSRDEMSGIMAGSGSGCEPNCSTNCVICFTESHGVESWPFDFNGSDPTDVCNNGIWYPGNQTITGTWGTC